MGSVSLSTALIVSFQLSIANANSFWRYSVSSFALSAGVAVPRTASSFLPQPNSATASGLVICSDRVDERL